MTNSHLLLRLATAASEDQLRDVLLAVTALPLTEQVALVVQVLSSPGFAGSGLENQLIERTIPVVHELLTDSRLDERSTLAIVSSAEELFGSWFQNPASDADQSYMFWDRVLFSRWRRDSPVARCAPQIAEALERILLSGSEACARSAIHGLNHLPKEHRSAVLRRYIDAGPPPPLAALAKDALIGKLQ